MKAFQETTEWSTEFAVPNHVYFLSDSKDKMYGYVKSGTGEIQEMSTPYRFKASGRKFTEVPNTWGFPSKEELTTVKGKFKVTGSRGDVYTVTEEQGIWTCTCLASKYQVRDCKHIKGLKTT